MSLSNSASDNAMREPRPALAVSQVLCWSTSSLLGNTCVGTLPGLRESWPSLCPSFMSTSSTSCPVDASRMSNVNFRGILTRGINFCFKQLRGRRTVSVLVGLTPSETEQNPTPQTSTSTVLDPSLHKRPSSHLLAPVTHLQEMLHLRVTDELRFRANYHRS